MDYLVRLFSLSGKFKIIGNEKVATLDEAKSIVLQHAESARFSRVTYIDDDDYSIRCTATTVGGRAGRNIASIEPGDNSWL